MLLGRKMLYILFLNLMAVGVWGGEDFEFQIYHFRGETLKTRGFGVWGDILHGAGRGSGYGGALPRRRYGGSCHVRAAR
jgi:hypothetical protein